MRFVRDQHGQVVRPEKLGLAAGVLGTRAAPWQIACEQLFGSLTGGRESEAQRLVNSLFLTGNTIATIGDDVVKPAMERIGALWLEGPVGIFVEHRATEICLRAFDEVQRVLRNNAHDPKLNAVVAAPERDPYLLSSALATLTLLENGWNATNLGAFTPLDVLSLAAHSSMPACSCSASAPSPSPGFAAGIARLLEGAEDLDCYIAVGGASADFCLGWRHTRASSSASRSASSPRSPAARPDAPDWRTRPDAADVTRPT